MKKKLYWHLRFHKSTYQIGLMLLLVVGLLVGVNVYVSHRKMAHREVVKSWPMIEAYIQDSKITFLDESSKSGFSGSYHVKLDVRYRSEENGREVETRVLGKWHYRQNVGDKGQFYVGNTIKLRVNPDHPEKLSMVDITGTI